MSNYIMDLRKVVGHVPLLQVGASIVVENGILTGTVLENPNRKWRFVERNENTFHWQNIIIQENGDITVNCEVFGKRKSEEA